MVTLTAEQMGMPAGLPTETLIVVDLEDPGARTRMTLRDEGAPADSPGATGWETAIDKMHADVAELRR